jgi:hypothetical protein
MPRNAVIDEDETVNESDNPEALDTADDGGGGAGLPAAGSFNVAA